MVHTIPEGAGSATCMGAVGPTLRLVDAFYMENGRTIEDPNSGYIERGFATKDGEHYNFSGVDMKTEAGRKTQIRDLKNLDAWGHARGRLEHVLQPRAAFLRLDQLQPPRTAPLFGRRRSPQRIQHVRFATGTAGAVASSTSAVSPTQVRVSTTR